MRQGEVTRNTRETQIQLFLNIDGDGRFEGATGVDFFDHMLEMMTRHGKLDLKVHSVGDLEADFHHLIEDVGITLGKAFSEILGDMRGITRYGDSIIPMDESLVLVALDFSGRPYLNYDLHLPAPKAGSIDVEVIKEFFYGFCRSAEATLHLRQLSGENAHHIFEAAFKGFGRAINKAVALGGAFDDEIPSTKGILRN